MKPLTAWALIAAALAAGWWSYRWQGLVLAVTVIVFWLLLQFSRSLRTLRKAAGAPVGHVASAVMLHSKLRPGLSYAQVLALAGSLGERVEPAAEGESWRWRDDGDASVTVCLVEGRVSGWSLARPES